MLGVGGSRGNWQWVEQGCEERKLARYSCVWKLKARGLEALCFPASSCFIFCFMT